MKPWLILKAIMLSVFLMSRLNMIYDMCYCAVKHSNPNNGCAFLVAARELCASDDQRATGRVSLAGQAEEEHPDRLSRLSGVGDGLLHTSGKRKWEYRKQFRKEWQIIR